MSATMITLNQPWSFCSAMVTTTHLIGSEYNWYSSHTYQQWALLEKLAKVAKTAVVEKFKCSLIVLCLHTHTLLKKESMGCLMSKPCNRGVSLEHEKCHY